MNLYKDFVRPKFFKMDPEEAHEEMLRMLVKYQKYPLFLWGVQRMYSVQDPRLVTNVAGLKFRNPVGIPAGLDKGAVALPFWEALGLGFAEVGTITPLPQIGNLRPRLFRLPEDELLINRMGFNNDGLAVIAARLTKFREQQSRRGDKIPMVVGANIGKNKRTPNEYAHEDYTICFRELFNLVDYFVVNVSSPNTPGLRTLQTLQFLSNLFSRFSKIRKANGRPKKPIFVKISPDLENEVLIPLIKGLDQIEECAGYIVFNTTISRKGIVYSDEESIEAIGAGGLSGHMLYHPMREGVQELRATTPKAIIASGGIDSPDRAGSVMWYGANLIQIYTAFIYEGPGLFKQILKQLSRKVA